MSRLNDKLEQAAREHPPKVRACRVCGRMDVSDRGGALARHVARRGLVCPGSRSRPRRMLREVAQELRYRVLREGL